MKNEFMFLLFCVALASPCMSAQHNYTKKELEGMGTDLRGDVAKLKNEEMTLRDYNENAREILTEKEEEGRALLNDIFGLQKERDTLESSCAEKKGEYERRSDERLRKIYEYRDLFEKEFKIVVNSVCERLYDEFGVKKPDDFFLMGRVVPGDSLAFVYDIDYTMDSYSTHGNCEKFASAVAGYVADNLRCAMRREKTKSVGEVILEEQKTMGKIMECEKDAVKKKKDKLKGSVETLDGAISSLNNFINGVDKLDQLKLERLSRNISMVCGDMYDDKCYVIIMDSDMAKKAFGPEKAEIIRRVMWQEDSKLTIRNDECGFLTYNQNGKEAFFSFKWIADMLENAAQSLFRPNN